MPIWSIIRSNAAISSGRVASRSTTTTVAPSAEKLSTLATVSRTMRSSIAPLAPNVVLTDCSNAGSMVKTATTVLLDFEEVDIRIRSERYLVELPLLLLAVFGGDDGWLLTGGGADCCAPTYAAELVVALTGGMTRPVR